MLVFFDIESYKINRLEANRLNDWLSQIMNRNVQQFILIANAEATDEVDHDEELKTSRAEAVKNFLVKKGIPFNKIVIRKMVNTQDHSKPEFLYRRVSILVH